MDTDDRLDLLLDRSRPSALTIDKNLARTMNLVADVAYTRVAAERPRTRKTPRLAVAVGLAALLTAGGGTAFAVGSFNWAPWAQDPDATYAFTLPSGRACEERVVFKQVKPIEDWDGFLTEVKKIVVDQKDVERWVAEIRSTPGTVQVLNAQGEVEDPSDANPPDDDDWYLSAHYVAFTDTTVRLSEKLGVDVDSWTAENAGVLCEAESQ